jgi:hypothetical protein
MEWFANIIAFLSADTKLTATTIIFIFVTVIIMHNICKSNRKNDLKLIDRLMKQNSRIEDTRKDKK